MFTADDAQRLRDALPAIDFSQPVKANALIRRYFDFYGLEFDSTSLPVIHSFGYYPSQQFRIACHYFAVPVAQQTGTVFLLHGYYDHAGLYTHLIRNCLEAGRAVVIFDMPGHGLSTGAPASIDSFDRYTRCLQDCLLLAQNAGLNQPWSLIGQSTGAAVIINHLLDSSPPLTVELAHCILLAPLLRPQAWLSSLFSYYFLHFLVRQTQRRFAVNSHDQEFLDFLRNSDPLQARHIKSDWVQALIAYQRKFSSAPVCQQRVDIIQGTEDTTVNWRFNLRKIEEKFPNSRTYLINQARHQLVNEAAPYRIEVLSTLNRILQ